MYGQYNIALTNDNQDHLMADEEGKTPRRTLQLLAFVSCIHVKVNIVKKKTIYCRLITLEDNFFLSLLLHIVKLKKTS